MKLRKCERCGEQTAEGLLLCPECMKESGAAAEAVAAAEELRDIARVLSITANTDTNIREAMTGILNIADKAGTEEIAMEVLRFIFSSFWVWLGAVVLIAAAGEAVAGIIKAIRQPRKITVHRAGDIVRAEVEGAGSRDIEAAFREAERFKILSGFKEDAE